MACSSCRKSPVVRRPSTSGGNGGIILPTPGTVNRAPSSGNDQRSKITGLRYVPK